jgi:hypothetical protein
MFETGYLPLSIFIFRMTNKREKQQWHTFIFLWNGFVGLFVIGFTKTFLIITLFIMICVLKLISLNMMRNENTSEQ